MGFGKCQQEKESQRYKMEKVKICLANKYLYKIFDRSKKVFAGGVLYEFRKSKHSHPNVLDCKEPFSCQG